MTRARRPLLVVGAGGFAREAVDAARAGDAYDVVGYVDDDTDRHGTSLAGVRVVGPVEAVHDHPGAAVVLATGRPSDYGSRRRLAERLALPEDRYACIVHPSAVVPASCATGAGAVLLAGVVLTSGVTVGSHVALMPHVVLTHDCRVEDYATLASGVCLGGGVVVATNAYLGAGALVREELTVGGWSLVAMGAVVTRDVPAGEVWAGVPARRIDVALRPGDPPE